MRLWASSLVPERKIAVAGTAGPLGTTAIVAWLFPDLSATAAAALASLATVLIGYTVRSKRPQSDPVSNPPGGAA